MSRFDASHLLTAVIIALLALPVDAQEASWPPEQSVLDVNNMTTKVRNDGFFPWRNPYAANDSNFLNTFYPKHDSVGVVFTQGIVWGGLVHDGGERLVRVNGNTYESGLEPGRVLIDDTTGDVIGADAPDLEKYHVWRVRSDWQDVDMAEAAAAFYEKRPEDVSVEEQNAVRDQYEADWNNWPAAWGAPYEDVDNDGTYDPTIDIPGYPGSDQTLWLVANDLEVDSTESLYGSPPIGIEYQLTLWAYDQPADEAMGNVHYARSRLIYTGLPDSPADARIDSMFIGLFADIDIGDYADDFEGYDTVRDLAYGYNSQPQDDHYEPLGMAPPAVGWDMVDGPVQPSGDTLGVYAFIYKHSGSDWSDPDLGDYSGTLQYYNLMRGKRPRPEYPVGEPHYNYVTDEPTRFMVTGDPFTRSGWVDGTRIPAGDRRFYLSTGPLTMSLGDTVDVVFAQIAALGTTNNLSSLSVLMHYDGSAQFYYNQNKPSDTGTASEERDELPSQIQLDAYPNPFNPSTTVLLELDRPQNVTVSVYDLLGRRVATLHEGRLSRSGEHRFAFDATGFSTGVYLLRAIGETATTAERIVLVK